MVGPGSQAVFLDRDGVINRTVFRDGKPRAPDRVEDFEFLPGVEDAVKRLRAAGFLIVVVTNQPDVARGWQTRDRVDAMNALVQERLSVDALKVCFHLAEDDCVCRKPRPGMLIEAAAELGIDLTRSYLVGDRRGDIEAGRAARCRASLLVEPDHHPEEFRRGEFLDFAPDGRFADLAAASRWIIGRTEARKIGVFDSGIGGVTVLNALRRRFAHDDFAYFGDTRNVPYGTKSEALIRQLSKSAAERIATFGLDLLVVACNTASSLALSEFEAALGPVPVFGMVEAGVEAVTAAHAEHPGGRKAPIVIFGTSATVRSGIYGKLLRAGLPGVSVSEQACPLLVPMIEEGLEDHAALRLVLDEYVSPYRGLSPGVALLGCTHYPWIRAVFSAALPEWTMIDSAGAVTTRLARAFSDPLPKDETSPGRIEWHFSDPATVAPFIFGDATGAGDKIRIEPF